MRFPRTTDGMVVWLGLDDEDARNVAAIRAWQGDAAAVWAMEQVEHLPVSLRGSAFFAVIKRGKRARKASGTWPEANHADWIAADVEADMDDPVALVDSPTE